LRIAKPRQQARRLVLQSMIKSNVVFAPIPGADLDNTLNVFGIFRIAE
jgi:hypothetical protein